MTEQPRLDNLITKSVEQFRMDSGKVNNVLATLAKTEKTLRRSNEIMEKTIPKQILRKLSSDRVIQTHSKKDKIVEKILNGESLTSEEEDIVSRLNSLPEIPNYIPRSAGDPRFTGLLSHSMGMMDARVITRHAKRVPKGSAVMRQVKLSVRGTTAAIAARLVINKQVLGSLLGDLGPVSAFLTSNATADTISFFLYGVFSSSERDWKRKLFSGTGKGVSRVSGMMFGFIIDWYGGGILATIGCNVVLQMVSGVIFSEIETILFPEKRKEQLIANTIIQRTKRQRYHEQLVKELKKGKTLYQIKRNLFFKLNMFRLENQKDFTLFLAGISVSNVIIAGIAPLAQLSAKDSATGIALSALSTQLDSKNVLYYQFLVPIAMKILSMIGLVNTLVEYMIFSLEKTSKDTFSPGTQRYLRQILTYEIIGKITLSMVLRTFATVTLNKTFGTAITQPELFRRGVEDFLLAGKGDPTSLQETLSVAMRTTDSQLSKDEEMVFDPLPENTHALHNVVPETDQSVAIETILGETAGKISELRNEKNNIDAKLHTLQGQIGGIEGEIPVYGPAAATKYAQIKEELQRAMDRTREFDDKLLSSEEILDAATKRIADPDILDGKIALEVANTLRLDPNINSILGKAKVSFQKADRLYDELNILRHHSIQTAKQATLGRLSEIKFFQEQEQFIESIADRIKTSDDIRFINVLSEKLNIHIEHVKKLGTIENQIEDLREDVVMTETGHRILETRLTSEQKDLMRRLETEAKVSKVEAIRVQKRAKERLQELSDNILELTNDGIISNIESDSISAEQQMINSRFETLDEKIRKYNSSSGIYRTSVFDSFGNDILGDPTSASEAIRNQIVGMTLGRYDKLKDLLTPETIRKYDLQGVVEQFRRAEESRETPAFDLQEINGINSFINDIAGKLSIENQKKFTDAIDKLSEASDNTRRSAVGGSLGISFSALTGSAAINYATGGGSSLLQTGMRIVGAPALAYLSETAITQMIPNIITSERIQTFFSETTNRALFGAADILKSSMPGYNTEEVLVMAAQESGITSFDALFTGDAIESLRNGIENSRAFTTVFWGDGILRDTIIERIGFDPAARVAARFL